MEHRLVAITNPNIHKVHIPKYTERILETEETQSLFEDRALYDEKRINIGKDVHPVVRKRLLELIFTYGDYFSRNPYTIRFAE